MLHWKLSKTFTQSKADEFGRLLELCLGKEVHPARQKSFILSREALRLALLQWGEVPLISDLILKNYCYLEQWPQFLVSLTHTREAGAAVVADRQKVISVGIDLELESREVSEAVANRVTGPRDLPLRKIELWCLKEAVYKCLMNTGKVEPAVRFSQIEILDHRWSYSPANLSGKWELHFTEGHVIALAYLPA